MKRQFRLPVFFVVVFASLVSSCTKNADGIVPGRGTISATIGGTNISFNSAASATRSSTSAASYLTINGYQGGINNSNSLQLTITALGNVTTGIYTENDTTRKAAVAYTQYASGAASNLYINAYSGTGTTITQIAITALSDTAVSGTFSGEVYLYNYSSNGSVPTSLPITNGQFDIKF